MTDAPPFSCEQRRLDDGRVRLMLRGELDYETAVFARRAIASAVPATDDLVIDLSGIEKADAFGLAVLLRARHTSAAEGCRVRLVNASPPLRAVWQTAQV
jgi:anti-anti-sigma factor